LTAGKLRWAVIDPVAQADALQGFERRDAPSDTWNAPVEQRQSDVLPRIKSRQQLEILKDKTVQTISNSRRFGA
jgi:hypothetical protein